MVSVVFPVAAGVVLVAFGGGARWAGFDVYPLAYVAAGVLTLAVAATGTPMDATLFVVVAVTALALTLVFAHRRESLVPSVGTAGDRTK
jgi:hypothetical protein